VRALELAARPASLSEPAALQRLLTDPARAVRVETAWALRATLDTNAPAARELLAYLRENADQPAGLFQRGVFHLDRGEAETALGYFQRATNWDSGSAPLRHALAVGLSALGRNEAAVRELEAACRLAPREAEYRFKLGLALNEAGRLAEAVAALQEAVKLEPEYAQAWYNLGLAFNAREEPERALEALSRAEVLDARSAQIPYAQATILVRLGRTTEARRAAQRALDAQPNHAEAAQLLRTLPP
jgi:tetratricopeptide (TPR) repeat protein